MVFEVDNTTEKLISELQSGIRSVIEDLERSQHEMQLVEHGFLQLLVVP